MPALAAAHAEAVHLGAAVGAGRQGQLFGSRQEVFASGRWLEFVFGKQVRAVVKVDGHVLQRHVVVLTIRGFVDFQQVVGQIGLAGPAGELFGDGLDGAHFQQLRLQGQAGHGHVRCLAAGDRDEQFVKVAVPGNVLGLDLDARVLGLEGFHQLVHDLGVFRVVHVVPEVDVLLRRCRRAGQCDRTECGAEQMTNFHGHVVSLWMVLGTREQ